MWPVLLTRSFLMIQFMSVANFLRSVSQHVEQIFFCLIVNTYLNFWLAKKMTSARLRFWDITVIDALLNFFVK